MSDGIWRISTEATEGFQLLSVHGVGKDAKPQEIGVSLRRDQWLVLAVTWLGWGFDLFDASMFSWIAPYCVPTLLHLPFGSAEARSATTAWVGIVSMVLLVGWAIGGIYFGRFADRFGRTRALVSTIALYAIATGLSGLAPNMAILLGLRFLASLGIGGEFAAGAALVAEIIPERRRLEAGAVLYTAGPIGILLAAVVSSHITGTVLADRPEVGWRYVFLCGLLPALLTLAIRAFVPEPVRGTDADSRLPRVSSLFQADLRRQTVTGTLLAFTAMLTMWTCNSFGPVFVGMLAQTTDAAHALRDAALIAYTESWKSRCGISFNVGSALGVLLTVPVAKMLGRKAMFALFYVSSTVTILITFGMDLDPRTRLNLFFLLGLTTFGVFGSFAYYLPELFPRGLRATGIGFCYNTGRVVAAVGPYIVGLVARGGLQTMLHALFWTGFIPLLGLAVLPWAQETRGNALL